MPGFLHSMGAVFARPARRREYNFDPVHPLLLDPRPTPYTNRWRC